MARLLLKVQRYFHRKPVRFFSLILLYLTAGSLIFLHSGLIVDSSRGSRDSILASNMGARTSLSDTRGLSIMGRVFKETCRTGRRYGPPWMRKEVVNRGGDYTTKWNRALTGGREAENSKAKYIGCYVDNIQKRALRGMSFFDYKKMTVFRCQDNCAERGYQYAGLEFGAECYCGHKIQAENASEIECNMECKGERSSLCGGPNRLSIYRLELSQESARRHGSAIFKGCFARPPNVTLALPFSAVLQNMSVDKCVDLCTEKDKMLAVLAGERCYCGFPTMSFSLHEPENDEMCYHRCQGEEIENCGNEEYYMVYQTQVQDNRCMDRHFKVPRSKELVALSSFPGSGNTWSRHIIELATGFYTGSYYFDGSLYNKGFKGEREHWKSGRTICVKTHEGKRKDIEAFNSTILIIRNPYRALIAEFNRQHSSHIGFASQAHWKGKEWPEFVKNSAPWWASHALDWLKYGNNVFVVYYEDLQRDFFAKMKEIVMFLGVKVSEDRLLCVESQKDGNFKRSGVRKLEYDPYTPEMREKINSLIHRVNTALKEMHRPGLPEDYLAR